MPAISDTPFEAPSPEYLAGLLPQYDIESFIAQGGMGAVYKGRQTSLDRDVAIKILPRELGEDPEFRVSFETEAKAMARLNHPNLLHVFDFGSAGGMPYIAMEYVDGQSLHAATWNRALAPSRAVAIVKGICGGLAHAHENGIVHRDIKPSNILLTQKGVPKIADFGLAHAADADKPGLVMGTPGYTAPEVFRNPNQAGPLADIYSVGVIFHQLLTGIDPTGSTQPPTQSTGNPRLDAIWRKATHIDPAQRYPSVAALAAGIESGFASKSAEAHSPRRVPTVHHRRPVRVETGGGDGSGVLVKLVILCTLAVAIFFTYRFLQDPKRKVGQGVTDANGTEQVEPPTPDPKPRPDPDPPARVGPKPRPDPTPVEIVTREEPPMVVEPEPEENPEADLPPGDPELLARATGLIADSRKKRDKELADNVRSLRFEFSIRARTAKTDEVKLIDCLDKEIVDDRIPIIDGTPGFGDKFAASIMLACAKEESIDTVHRADLTKIRDAYVTRLKAGAAAGSSDPELKRRLLAQADRASNLDAWIRLLSPEPERSPKKFFAGGFAGKWSFGDTGIGGDWIAHLDGTMEIVYQTRRGTWEILEDGTLEVRFANREIPYTFTRDGAGWTGETSSGRLMSLTRAD